MRKVISFATWLKKSCWRIVSRGLQIALQRGPDNWQVWSLRDAPAILRRKLSNLSMPGDPHVCSRCGGPKSHLEATVHDAGQFFECDTVTDALQAARGVLQLTAQHTGCFHASVFRKKKKAGSLSTHSFRFLPRKFRCFDFQELFLVFAAAISVTYVSAGSHVVKLSTLSSGGIMSMIASAMVLCLSEHKWLQRRTAWVATGFSDSLPWNEQVAALRYVDDLPSQCHVLRGLPCDSARGSVPGAFQISGIGQGRDMDRSAPRLGPPQHQRGAENIDNQTTVSSEIRICALLVMWAICQMATSGLI